MATLNALSNYGENAVIDWVVTGSGQKYLALFTGAVGEDGSGTEITASWYARQPIAFGAAVDGVAHNSGTVAFGKVTGSALTITNWALFDADTGGNMWVYGDFTDLQISSPGNNVLVQAGDITVSAD